MQIFVNILCGQLKTISLEVEPDDRIQDVGSLILEKEEIPKDSQRVGLLTFDRKELEVTQTLRHYNIKEESLLCCSLVDKIDNMGNRSIIKQPDMIVHIITLGGKSLSFVVQATTLVEELKGLIQRESRLDTGELRLIGAGKQLEDGRSLGDYNYIENGCTLHLIGRLRGGGGYEIFATTPTGKAISILAVDCDTIGNIKSKIEEKEQIRTNKQSLFFANRWLEDDKTLSDYNIRGNDALRLVLKPGFGKMNIHVQLPDGNTLKLHVRPNARIFSCKKMIEDIPSDQQTIIFDCKELRNSKRLSEYNIHGESLMHVVRTNGTITVHIMSPAQKEIVSLRAYPSDSVLSLKARISVKVLAPPCKQRLLLNNEIMKESHSLSFYSIPPNNIITLCVLIKVRINAFNRKELIKIKIFEEETVESLKSKIQKKDGVEPARQQLYCEGLLLEDGRTMASYGIVEDSLIELSKSLPTLL